MRDHTHIFFLPCHSIAFSRMRMRFQASNGKPLLSSPHGLLQSMQVVCFSSLNLLFLNILDFNSWNFVPMEIWGTAKLNFPYLVSLTQVSKLGAQKMVTEPKKFSSTILKVSLFFVFLYELLRVFLVYAVAQTRQIKRSKILSKACCSEVYSKHSQISNMMLFMKIVNSWKPLTIFAKSSIVDVWLGSEYTSAVQIIRNKIKFEDTKEHFISEGLLNICKLYIFGGGRGSGVPLLNLRGSRAPLLNFEGGPGSRGPGLTFTACPQKLDFLYKKQLLWYLSPAPLLIASFEPELLLVDDSVLTGELRQPVIKSAINSNAFASWGCILWE